MNRDNAQQSYEALINAFFARNTNLDNITNRDALATVNNHHLLLIDALGLLEAENSFLQGNQAQAYFDALVNCTKSRWHQEMYFTPGPMGNLVFSVIGLACAFIRVKELLNEENAAGYFSSLVNAKAYAFYLADLFNTLPQFQFLKGKLFNAYIEPINRAIQNARASTSIIRQLQHTKLLSGDHAQANILAILAIPELHGINLANAIAALKETNVFTGEEAQNNFDALVAAQKYALQLADIFHYLKHTELFSGVNSQANYNALLKSGNGLGHIRSALLILVNPFFTGTGDQFMFDTLINAGQFAYSFALGLHLLSAEGIMQEGTFKFYFDTLVQAGENAYLVAKGIQQLNHSQFLESPEAIKFIHALTSAGVKALELAEAFCTLGAKKLSNEPRTSFYFDALIKAAKPSALALAINELDGTGLLTGSTAEANMLAIASVGDDLFDLAEAFSILKETKFLIGPQAQMYFNALVSACAYIKDGDTCYSSKGKKAAGLASAFVVFQHLLNGNQGNETFKILVALREKAYPVSKICRILSDTDLFQGEQCWTNLMMLVAQAERADMLISVFKDHHKTGMFRKDNAQEMFMSVLNLKCERLFARSLDSHPQPDTRKRKRETISPPNGSQDSGVYEAASSSPSAGFFFFSHVAQEGNDQDMPNPVSSAPNSFY